MRLPLPLPTRFPHVLERTSLHDHHHTRTHFHRTSAAGPGHRRPGDHAGRAGAAARRGCLPTPSDPQVSAALVRRYGLRKGDTVEGLRDGRRALIEVERINGRTPGELHARPHFRDLTPLHPRERLRLEHPASGLTGRLVDLVAPVGKGQRGLIVAPPKTGKTVLLQQVAAAIAANHPEAA